uniref:NADH-ubiquinone oxidoreductase chain 6 n=1 Tax=Bathysphyraenops simplex TaxID=2838355 RepID=A0AA95Z3T0_9TELE|nr:NADH dehydrogenase subunit 6 [Bathysphyraenops simplex]
MTLILFLLFVGTFLGMLAFAFNPSPYFAALGLVVVAGAGGVVLACNGGSFLALVMVLIYLGGMLVAFAYATAVSADLFPETLGGRAAEGGAGFVAVYIGGVGTTTAVLWGSSEGWGASYSFGEVKDLVEFHSCRPDTAGVASMYSPGGKLLFISAWALALTLAVVLHVSRGKSLGGVRDA